MLENVGQSLLFTPQKLAAFLWIERVEALRQKSLSDTVLILLSEDLTETQKLLKRQSLSVATLT